MDIKQLRTWLQKKQSYTKANLVHFENNERAALPNPITDEELASVLQITK